MLLIKSFNFNLNNKVPDDINRFYIFQFILIIKQPYFRHTQIVL